LYISDAAMITTIYIVLLFSGIKNIFMLSQDGSSQWPKI